jgi:hypothetical protein
MNVRTILLLLCFIAGLLSIQSEAQTISTIEGTVRDQQGLPLPGAQIKLSGEQLSEGRSATTDSIGFYRITALPAGGYTLTASYSGFATRSFRLEVGLNRTVTLDIKLDVGQVKVESTVRADAPLLERHASSAGSAITPQQIVTLPLNGRNFLDLMQLAPGVAVNRQADAGTDVAVPVLGERGGNTVFLIDGLSNQDALSGGAAAQFNQETIAEFQVITTGHKAEFGRGSGGVVNVITRSGTNEWHALGSLFHRHDALDSSNVAGGDAPFLRRWDYTMGFGGPVIKDRAFFFGSAERIAERRQLNFVFPPLTPQALRDFESRFDDPSRSFETRLFARSDQQLGRHRLTQQMNLTNRHLSNFLPLSQATNLPSTRQDVAARHLMIGLTDTILIGGASNPMVLTLRGMYRGEPAAMQPSHPEAGPATLFEIFSGPATGKFFGDQGQVTFGAALTPSELRQKYFSTSASLAVFSARHHVNFGGSFVRTRVDGEESSLLLNQIFATEADFARYGPVFAGLFSLRTRGGAKPEDSLIRLRNNYTGLFAQDDYRVHSNLTLNLGVRWDYDARFPSKRNFSPRLGAAWAVTPKTVVRGSWGFFYDQFRLGLARDIPAFGGASITNIQPVSYPRLFYGVPTIAPIVFGLCLSPTQTDAQITAAGERCRLGPLPLIGVDRLNRVVAPGRDPIPADAVVTINTVQSLTGLTPQQFAEQASRAIGRGPGFFFWGPFGVLTHAGSPATAFPVTLDPRFRTPHSRSLNIGVQREVMRDLVVEIEYFHKEIRDIAGVRLTNIPFAARLPGNHRRFDPPSTEQEIRGFGSWFNGTYDALTAGFTKRFSRRFTLAANYTRARAIDNLRCPHLATGLSLCVPSDSFVGVVPVVTEAETGRSNQQGEFMASNGNPVPKAGVFYNGPDLDRGPSDLAHDHTFLAHGMIELPRGFALSGIFRAQSGFHFSRQAAAPIDVDGDLNFNDIDHTAGRNAFTAPAYLNLDLRVAKQWQIGERLKLTSVIEFFNLFNTRNAAAVERGEGRPVPFGRPLQTLPGREGQIGLRIEF